MVTNKEISHILRSVAATYILTKENRFKIIAYERAADTIDHLDREIFDIWENGDLLSLSGIGSSILSHIDEYFKKKQDSHLVKVMSKIPASTFALMKIPHIGPKKAYKLVNVLNLKNSNKAIDDLYNTCLKNRVAQIESFGLKSQAEIMEGIEIYRQAETKQERMPLPYAYSLAKDIISYLKKHSQINRVDALGSLRRMTSTVGDVDLAVQVKRSTLNIKRTFKDIIEYFVSYPKKVSVLNAGKNKASILVIGNRQIDLRIQEEMNYGSMLQYFTGSKTHNIKLREFALKFGYSLSEYGIKSKNKKSKIYKFANEKDFYIFLGLQYIPPELREGTDEIEFAQKHKLPDLVTFKDIKGDFHLHSSYNLEPSHDLGENSYEEILDKAKDFNYQYIVFSDHNPSISKHTNNEIVNILKQRKEFIVQTIMSKKYERIKYFISLEVDILPDGKIALPEEGLNYLDMIIVSIHSSFNMEKERMTNRILKALSFPKVKILGHPTSRLLGKRQEINVSWDVVFNECNKKNIALEVNAWPKRLDLPDNLVRLAVKKGTKLVIGTDAHAVSEMDNMFYGVAVARRGWAKKNDIMNTKSYKEVRKWIEKSNL